MDNLSMPAEPLPNDAQGSPYRFQDFEDPNLNRATGFSKRERACIDLRIPESGDDELDVLIKKARYFETATKAMQGLIEQGHPSDSPEVAFAHASAIIGMMERMHD